ncbi:MAG: hypothetical protein KBT34_10700 [Prevotella sp.]|nr:hypothetical protein [Candidatus Prevotella equi]
MKTFFYSDETIDFLKGYTPKNEFFTGDKEVEEIVDNLYLDICLDSEDVRKVRNSVVMFYTELAHKENKSYMSSMQSVTAVCDHYMVTHFGTL